MRNVEEIKADIVSIVNELEKLTNTEVTSKDVRQLNTIMDRLNRSSGKTGAIKNIKVELSNGIYSISDVIRTALDQNVNTMDKEYIKEMHNKIKDLKNELFEAIQ